MRAEVHPSFRSSILQQFRTASPPLRARCSSPLPLCWEACSRSFTSSLNDVAMPELSVGSRFSFHSVRHLLQTRLLPLAAGEGLARVSSMLLQRAAAAVSEAGGAQNGS